MLAIDVMTTPIVTASPETAVSEIARLMLERHISAVPILDEHGLLVGIVSEGDLLRRYESGTERKRSR
jgi:CBS domain-containing protein